MTATQTERPAIHYSSRFAPKMTREQRDAAFQRYSAGESCKKIACEYGISTALIYMDARLRGFRCFTNAKRPRKLINEGAFSVMTPDAAYWVGFLMADGCITNGDRRVSLFLAERDKAHIEAFRQFLGSEHMVRPLVCRSPISKDVSRQVCFAFTSDPIVADLARYGVVPRKSLIAECVGLEFNRDFWRGVVDGNGTLGHNRDKLGRDYPTIGLCGSRALMQQFAAFILHTQGGRPVNVRPASKIFIVSVACSRAKKLARTLYENASTALARKHALAVGMFEP